MHIQNNNFFSENKKWNFPDDFELRKEHPHPPTEIQMEKKKKKTSSYQETFFFCKNALAVCMRPLIGLALLFFFPPQNRVV